MSDEQKRGLKSALVGLGFILLIAGPITGLYADEVGLLIALLVWVVAIPLLRVFGLAPSSEVKAGEPAPGRSGIPLAVTVVFIVVAVVFIALPLILSLVSSLTGRSTSETAESRPVSGFTRVEVKVPGRLIIDQTGDESLKIKGDQGVVDRIDARVVGDTLVIENKRPWFFWNFWPARDLSFFLEVDKLERVAISGSGAVRADKLAARDFGLRISGSGSALMGLEARDVDVDISGSGTIGFSGKARSQDVTISGSGAYDAKKLKTKTARVAVNGSGDAIVNAADSLDVAISGSGRVRYLGSPKLKQETSGSGSVSSY